MSTPPRLSLVASLQQARKLLGIQANDITLTKSCIRNAFIVSAKLHHPDARHISAANPCALKFNRCKEARDLLLFHHCHIGKRVNINYHTTSSSDNLRYQRQRQQEEVWREKRSGNDRWFGGFPSRPMRLFSVKVDLFLRSIVLSVVIFGTLYDEWYGQKRISSDDDEVQESKMAN
mmetsp:Transcript_11519/g.13141  ORF Transcript_11519/g.13141 Transcript_11519/m.13141 type:complete len:176 (+) Transcript_11519:44-571(+)